MDKAKPPMRRRIIYFEEVTNSYEGEDSNVEESDVDQSQSSPASLWPAREDALGHTAKRPIVRVSLKSRAQERPMTVASDEPLGHSEGNGREMEAAEARKWECEICTYASTRRDNLKSHIVIQHSDMKTFGCHLNGCLERFKTKSQLKSHVQRHHTVKEYPCPRKGCDKRFIYALEAARHEITAHAMEKPFLCPVCPTGFTADSSMRRHLNHLHNPLLTPKQVWQLQKRASSTSSSRASTTPTSTHSLNSNYSDFSNSYHAESRIDSSPESGKNSTPMPGMAYRCEFCDKVFAELDSLIKHKHSHGSDAILE